MKNKIIKQIKNFSIMGTTVRGLLQNIWQPQLQFVRFKGKINITNPRPPHFKRALLETVCVPYFKEKKQLPYLPNFDLCEGPPKKAEAAADHPVELILANEALKWFKDSKMIAFFHENSMSPEEKFQNQLAIKKIGMKLRFFGKKRLLKGLKGTIYESLIKLYDGPTATVFSSKVDISSLLKISKKLPKLILMAAVVDDRVLSLSEMEDCGKFESIEEAQVNLLTSINTSPGSVIRQLNHHANNLVVLLNEYQKILKGDNKDS